MLNTRKGLPFNRLKLLYHEPYRLMYVYIGIAFTAGTLVDFNSSHWFSEIFDIMLGIASFYAAFLRDLGAVYVAVALVLTSTYSMLTITGIAFGAASLWNICLVPMAIVMVYTGVRRLRKPAL